MRALLLAYYFPPIGGGGSQRSLKFARYLPDFGFEVTVITGPGATRQQWSPPDETLLVEVQSDAIWRVHEPEPLPSGRWRSRVGRWLDLTPAWSRWWRHGVLREGLRLETEVDVIVASMSPFATAVAARDLSRELGKPWVADLRDPWALDEMLVYPTLLHRRREVARMERLLSTASAVVANTPEAALRIAALPALADTPVVAISNGFDSNDFENTPAAPRNGAFRIVHTGHLHTETARDQRGSVRRLLSGSVAGVEILTRSHVYLLDAIERLIARHPSLRQRIELLLAGVLSDSDVEAVHGCSVVRALGYLPHHETIALMRSADLLFLPMYKLRDGGRSGIVPGKTYEYLAAQRPILAAVPEGDARDILAEAGSAHICEPDDVEGMAAAIEGQLSGSNARPADVSPQFLERFERRSLTAGLASVLEGVADRHRSS
jgi:glycosyltransferase involved in cell wall biosynthesis